MTIELRTSTANRWMNCPGSVRLYEEHPQKPYPKTDGNDLAVHDLFRIALRSVKHGTALDDVFRQAEELTDEMMHALRAADEVEQILRHAMNPTLFIDKTYSLSWTRIPELIGGRPIGIILEENDLGGVTKMTVLDYSYSVVDKSHIENNPRLRLYALAAMQELDVPAATEIQYICFQPRHWVLSTLRYWYEDGEYVKDWFENTARPVIEKILSGEGEFVPGTLQCQKCKMITKCPAMQQHQNWLGNIGDTATMNTQEKIQALKMAPLITKFQNALKEEVIDEISSGSNEYKGYITLCPRAGRRIVTDEGREDLETILGDEAFKKTPRPFKELEDIMGPIMSADERTAWFDKYTERGEHTLLLKFVDTK